MFSWRFGRQNGKSLTDLKQISHYIKLEKHIEKMIYLAGFEMCYDEFNPTEQIKQVKKFVEENDITIEKRRLNDDSDAYIMTKNKERILFFTTTRKYNYEDFSCKVIISEIKEYKGEQFIFTDVD